MERVLELAVPSGQIGYSGKQESVSVSERVNDLENAFDVLASIGIIDDELNNCWECFCLRSHTQLPSLYGPQFA